MPPGSWLVSLDFAVPDVEPVASLPAAGHTVHVYQLPLWPETSQLVQQAMDAPVADPDAMAWQAIYPQRQPPRVKHREPPRELRRGRWGLRR